MLCNSNFNIKIESNFIVPFNVLSFKRDFWFFCKDRITKFKIWNYIIKNLFVIFYKLNRKIFLTKIDRIIS